MCSEGYCSWVFLSVCLSMLQLTPRLFVHPANDTIYFTGNDNQFNLAVFSEYAPLQRSERCQHSTHTNSWPFFTLRKRTCALFLPRGGSRRWRGRRRSEVLAIMSPSKVFPQCQASVLKVCKSYSAPLERVCQQT